MLIRSLSFSYKDDRNKSDNKSIALLAASGLSITKDLIEFKELNKKCGFNCADKLSNCACFAIIDSYAISLVVSTSF